MRKTDGEFKGNTYKGIRIDFLQALLGEDWKNMFDRAWGSKKEFMKDYKEDYKEWLGFAR